MLESLKEFKVTSIGTKVMTNDDRPLVPGSLEIDWEAFDKMREEFPICIDFETGMVSFKMMTKPASEGGSGAQLTDFIEMAGEILIYLNKNYPCTENSYTLRSLYDASFWQKERTKDRDARGVEGKNEE